MHHLLRPMRAVCMIGVALAVPGGGCTPVLSPVPESEATEGRPPPDWTSAVRFYMVDSVSARGFELPYGARVDFFDGRQSRAVTSREIGVDENDTARSPWYRLWIANAEGEAAVPMVVTIGDPDGVLTVAEYVVPASPGTYYEVYIAVGTWNRRPAQPSTALNPRGFDVTAAARAQPTDSLWISYSHRSIGCYDCPS
jgi:hypothetical protein